MEIIIPYPNKNIRSISVEQITRVTAFKLLHFPFQNIMYVGRNGRDLFINCQ